MPEGDTIHRAARTLHAALAGRRVTRFETVLPVLARVDEDSPLRGRVIESVAARGKHLLIAFSGDLVLRTHMRMNGSWHIYRSGERWQRPRGDMRIVVETDDFVAVGFNIPDAEFIAATAIDRSDALRRLGPDLIADDFDPVAARERLAARSEMEIGNALLDQRALAGIGNVYKSEVLFMCGVDPFRAVGSLSAAELDALIASARKFLRHNASANAAGRETRGSLRGDARLWVYGRRGQPCRRCGSLIRMKRQGSDARVTFWCPQCQR